MKCGPFAVSISSLSDATSRKYNEGANSEILDLVLPLFVVFLWGTRPHSLLYSM